MKVFRINLFAVLMFLAVPAVMHAQSGCSDSPEAPTDVLMLVGSIGMMFGSSMAMKAMRKNKKQN
jgi:XrtJ-associated TM-motif-TM protein